MSLKYVFSIKRDNESEIPCTHICAILKLAVALCLNRSNFLKWLLSEIVVSNPPRAPRLNPDFRGEKEQKKRGTGPVRAPSRSASCLFGL